MRLSDEDLREFAVLWEESFGEKLSPAAAREHATELLTFCLLLLQAPLTLESPKSKPV